MICQLPAAEAEGHEVLFTPPCHSEFQPVELLWAKLKGNIGRKRDSNTTMSVPKERLDAEFKDSLKWHESVEGFMRKSTETAQKFWEEAQKDDDEEDQAPNDAETPDEDQENGGLVRMMNGHACCVTHQHFFHSHEAIPMVDLFHRVFLTRRKIQHAKCQSPSPFFHGLFCPLNLHRRRNHPALMSPNSMKKRVEKLEEASGVV